MIAAVKRRLFPVDPVLPGYRAPKNPLWIKLRNGLFIGTLIFVGLFYGLLSAIFPYFMYIYLLFPLVILMAFVIWALPDAKTFPAKTVERLFWLFFATQLIWPNYIAIAIPGLPWITINRLVTAPLAIIFLISLSVSQNLRSLLKEEFANARFMSWSLLLFAVLQVVTVFMSSTIAGSLNKLIDAEIQWTLVFVVAAFVFAMPGRARTFFKYYPWLIFFLFVIAVFEWRANRVLWANSIPSFLKSNDESTQRLLEGSARAATGQYRVQSIFSTSLNFAEVMAWTVPFLIYWIMYAKRVWVRLLCVFALPPLYWMILRTDSRLGVVGFFASFIIFAGLYGVRRWVKTRGDIIGPAIVLFYPFATALFFVATMVSHRLGGVIWGNGSQAASTEGRKVQWAVGWPKIGAWPFGHGMGSSGDVLGVYNQAGVLTIDSYYLVVLLDYGVLGFLAWLGMIIGSALQAAKWGFARDDEETRMLPIMATFMLVFLIIKGVLAQEDSHGIAYMMLGMIVGVTWRVSQRQKISRGETPSVYYRD
jgi:hypothetical protein